MSAIGENLTQLRAQSEILGSQGDRNLTRCHVARWRYRGAVIRTRRTLADIPHYKPGRSAESVAAEHELARAIKLASNEVPFGPLPAALEAAAAAMLGANRYPDNDTGRAARGARRPARRGRRPGAGGQRLGAALPAPVPHHGGARRRGGVLLAVVRGVPDPGPAGRRGGAAHPVARPHLRPRRHGRRGERAHPPRVRVHARTTRPARSWSATRCERFLARVPDDCLVVFDEAYREFVTDPDTPDGLELIAEHPNVLVLRTFSKAYGLAALRVGYAMARSRGDRRVAQAARALRGERGRAGGRARRHSVRRRRCANGSTG